MATKQEINNYYKERFNKDIPSGTLTRWIKEGKLRAIKNNHNRYDYNFEDFVNIIEGKQYTQKFQATREKPNDYIGKTKGYLYIKGIVPKNEYQSNYNGTLMYCDCLACGKQNVQVRFTYLSDNGNYDQLSCGCNRKRRAFLATSRLGIDEEYLLKFDDFEKFLLVHKLLTHISDNYYGVECDLNEYKEALEWLYNDKQFNKIYNFWHNQERSATFYDLSKPSLDHIIPLSRGGSSHYSNLQVLTVFENLAKRDMTMDEWNDFKIKTNTHSNFFIEEVMRYE